MYCHVRGDNSTELSCAVPVWMGPDCQGSFHEHLQNYKKEVNNFLRATEGKIYNRMVENSVNDNKLLGLRRYRLECSVASNTIQDRKIVKVTETVQATDPDSAREKFIGILRERYGESVLWDRIRIERLK